MSKGPFKTIFGLCENYTCTGTLDPQVCYQYIECMYTTACIYVSTLIYIVE